MWRIFVVSVVDCKVNNYYVLAKSKINFVLFLIEILNKNYQYSNSKT